jgi:hypothetical protein
MSELTITYDLDDKYLQELDYFIKINNGNKKWNLNNRLGTSNCPSNCPSTGTNNIICNNFNYNLIPCEEYLERHHDTKSYNNIKINNKPRNRNIYNIIKNKFSDSHMNCTGEVSKDICVICQDGLDNTITKLPCNHTYHNNCIVDWVYENWNKYEIPIGHHTFADIYKCPLCSQVF